MKALCTGDPCQQCGLQLPAGLRRTCPAYLRSPRDRVQPVDVVAPIVLGDWTESMLASVGVTPERYVEAKRLFGLSPSCNCAQRKAWLNAVSEWLRGGR